MFNIKLKKKGYGIFKNKNNKIRALSNFDIINIMNSRKGKNKNKFVGVFSRDDLPKKINKNESLIFNLDGVSGSGTHWVCIYDGDDSVEYMDSYGMPPTEESITYMKTLNKPIIYSSSQIQSINSILCGYYCMYFINERDNGNDMYDIIYRFDQIVGNGLEIKKNSKILIEYFNIK